MVSENELKMKGPPEYRRAFLCFCLLCTLSAGSYRLLQPPAQVLPKLFLGNCFLDSGSTSFTGG